MKLVFVSGPYRSTTILGRYQNIVRAREASIELWQAGYAVICPHLNTANFDGLAPDKVWLDGDIEMLRRCDAIYMLRDWDDSVGARAEHEMALKLGLEIIYQPLK